jgi:hypothetical protein
MSLPEVLICSQCGHSAVIKSGTPTRTDARAKTPIPVRAAAKMRVSILRGMMIAILTLVVSNRVAFGGPLEDGRAAYDRGDYATALRLITGGGGQDILGRYGSPNTLEHKLPDLFNDDGVFHRHEDARAN